MAPPNISISILFLTSKCSHFITGDWASFKPGSSHLFLRRPMSLCHERRAGCTLAAKLQCKLAVDVFLRRQEDGRDGRGGGAVDQEGEVGVCFLGTGVTAEELYIVRVDRLQIGFGGGQE